MKAAVVVYFKMLLRHSYEETEENQRDLYGIQCFDCNIESFECEVLAKMLMNFPVPWLLRCV